MDIADYIRELLGQQGELSIPGLGYFVQLRKSAHYNEAEKTFYPPYNQVQFDPQTIDDDDALANYITERKSISLASSRYFLDKYVSTLKEQALLQDVAFGDFGWISMNHDQVLFKPNNAIPQNDPAFYGFSPVQLNDAGIVTPVAKKVEPAPPIHPPLPVLAPKEEVSYNSSVTQYAPEALAEDHFPHVFNLKPGGIEIDEDIEETYERRRSLTPWIVVLVILVLLAAGAFITKKYRPDLYNKLLFTSQKTDTPRALPVVIVPKDTILAPGREDFGKAAGSDTSKNAAAIVNPPTSIAAKIIVPDSIAKGDWLIYGGEYSTLADANDGLDNYKELGLTQARLLTVTPKPGEKFKILLGDFKTEKEAKDAKLEMSVATVKLSGGKLSIQQYKK